MQNIYVKNFTRIKGCLVALVAEAFNRSILSAGATYHAHAVLITVTGGGDSFLVVITAIGASVTNIAVFCASSVYSFGYAVCMLTLLGGTHAVKGSKAIKHGQGVIIRSGHCPNGFKIPTKVGCYPVLRHKHLKALL